MKKLLKYLLLAFVATSCAAPRQLESSTSSRVEVRTETVTLTDTVFVELPVIEQSVLTLDTLSVLENKIAISEAKVSGGTLSHTLATKPVKQPVSVEKQVVYRDSLVYVDNVIREDRYIEKELTPGQKTWIKMGKIFAALLLIVVFYIIFLISKHLKPKLL